MTWPESTRIAIVLLCAGAVLFLLRVLHALVSEEWRLRDTRMHEERFKPAKFSPKRQRERLVVVDAETLTRRFGPKARKE